MKLYKTTIVIWSEFDPSQCELIQLARKVLNDAAYCSKQSSEAVEKPETDPDWDGTRYFVDLEEPVTS